MAEENITFFENDDKSYAMVDLHININIYFHYEVMKILTIIMTLMLKKILLIKNSYNEYFIRHYNVNKMILVPLQLKINNIYNELNTFANNNRVMLIYNDDKEFFRKCIEIWKYDRIKTSLIQPRY